MSVESYYGPLVRLEALLSHVKFRDWEFLPDYDIFQRPVVVVRNVASDNDRPSELIHMEERVSLPNGNPPFKVMLRFLYRALVRMNIHEASEQYSYQGVLFRNEHHKQNCPAMIPPLNPEYPFQFGDDDFTVATLEYAKRDYIDLETLRWELSKIALPGWDFNAREPIGVFDNLVIFANSDFRVFNPETNALERFRSGFALSELTPPRLIESLVWGMIEKAQYEFCAVDFSFKGVRIYEGNPYAYQ